MKSQVKKISIHCSCCCTLDKKNYPEVLRVMRGFLSINIRYTELILISQVFCIRRVIAADLENYDPGEAFSFKTFRWSFVKICYVVYNVQWVYTNTHIQHEDFICLLCLLITENKTVQKINKSCDTEKRGLGLFFFLLLLSLCDPPARSHYCPYVVAQFISTPTDRK